MVFVILFDRVVPHFTYVYSTRIQISSIWSWSKQDHWEANHLCLYHLLFPTHTPSERPLSHSYEIFKSDRLRLQVEASYSRSLNSDSIISLCATLRGLLSLSNLQSTQPKRRENIHLIGLLWGLVKIIIKKKHISLYIYIIIQKEYIRAVEVK